jgi:serine/threonine protein kinase/GAF domain-containing protein
MGAGASKPAGAKPAFLLRPRRDPKPTKRQDGDAAVAPAPAAPAAPPPQPAQHDDNNNNDNDNDSADAAAYARTCAALERVLDEGVRAGRGHLNTGRRRTAAAQRYSAAAARAAERRAAKAFDAANGLPPADDDEENVPAEAAAVARAALGLSESENLPQRSYWAGPPIPECEPQRLQAMAAYGLLADAALPDEEDEDEEGDEEGGEAAENGNKTTKKPTTTTTKTITATTTAATSKTLRPAIESALKLVRGVFGVDEALVALFGDRRVFIRDSSGIFATGDFPWRYSFCYWTLAPPSPTALVVRDVRADARFSANSVARRAGVRFYCGVPLIAPNGHRLGVLCFASRDPRPDFDAASVSVAGNLAELVARELARETQLAVARRVSAAARLRLRDMAEASAPVLLVERVEEPERGAGEEERQQQGGRWVVRHANGAWTDLVARARRAQRVRSAAAAAAAGGTGAENGAEGDADGDADPFGGALGRELWEVFEPPAPKPAPATALIVATPSADGAPHPPRPIPGDSATSLPLVRAVGAGGGGGADAAKGGPPPPPLALLPPPSNSSSHQDDNDARLFALQAPFSVHGARLRRPPFGRRLSDAARAAAAPPPPPIAPRVTLRFVPAAAPGALGVPPGAQLTAAPASLPDAPLEEAQRRRLASLWFVDVEPEPLLLAGGPASASAASASATATAAASAQPPSSQSLPPAGSDSLPSSAGTAAEDARPGMLVPGLQPPPLLRPSPGLLPASSSSLGVGGLTISQQQQQQQQQLPPSLAGLVLGAPLACGSYGRVFRGRFRAGERVAVKVLDPEDVGKCDETTGAALEATLGERLRHPNVVQTLAWGVVEAGSAAALPPKPRAWTRRRASLQQQQQQQQRSSGVGGGRPSTESGVGGGGNSGSGGSGSGNRQQNNPFAQAAKMQAFRHGQALSGSDDDDEDDDDGGNGNGNNLNAPPPSSSSSSLPTSPAAAANASSSSLSAPLPPLPNQTWLVLEYCDRGSLQEAIDAGWLRTGRDPRSASVHLPALLATAREVAAGMAHLHREGVVHGDLSAYNVLLASGAGAESEAAALGGRGWTAKVADFGLARAAQQQVIKTRTYGTVTHQAPEVLMKGELSFAADVYSFGVLLWQGWTGARPWQALSHAQVVRMVAIEGAQLRWPDDAPQGLATLGEACLSRDPEDRPTFADVLEVLDPLVEVLLSAAAEGASGSGRNSGS